MAKYVRVHDGIVVSVGEPTIGSNGAQYVRITDGTWDYHTRLEHLHMPSEFRPVPESEEVGKPFLRSK